MTPKFLKSKPVVALFGASGIIAIAGFAGTTLVAHASPTGTPSTLSAPNNSIKDSVEAPKTSTSKVDADGPNGPDDQAGTQQGLNDQSGPDTEVAGGPEAAQ